MKLYMWVYVKTIHLSNRPLRYSFLIVQMYASISWVETILSLSLKKILDRQSISYISQFQILRPVDKPLSIASEGWFPVRSKMYLRPDLDLDNHVLLSLLNL